MRVLRTKEERRIDNDQKRETTSKREKEKERDRQRESKKRKGENSNLSTLLGRERWNDVIFDNLNLVSRMPLCIKENTAGPDSNIKVSSNFLNGNI